MKRISALLCVVLALALTSCGNDTGVCPDPPCSVDSDSSTVDRIP